MATDFPSWDHLVSHIKSSEVILNRIGLVSRQRSDSSWKHRIIWDLRRSGVNSLTRQTERVILPRVEDVANDIMNLTRSSGKDERVFLLSADIVDAFHQIPVHPSEQRFTATSVGVVVSSFGFSSLAPARHPPCGDASRPGSAAPQCVLHLAMC